MLRENESAAPDQTAAGDIVDAMFAISCRSLPVDHAYALSQAIFETNSVHAGIDKSAN